MSEVPAPTQPVPDGTVLWCQDSQSIFLRLMYTLQSKADLQIKLARNRALHWLIMSQGKGRPKKLFDLNLEFYGEVERADEPPHMTVNSISVAFTKLPDSTGEWPQLLVNEADLAKKRIEFDHEQWNAFQEEDRRAEEQWRQQQQQQEQQQVEIGS